MFMFRASDSNEQQISPNESPSDINSVLSFFRGNADVLGETLFDDEIFTSDTLSNYFEDHHQADDEALWTREELLTESDEEDDDYGNDDDKDLEAFFNNNAFDSTNLHFGSVFPSISSNTLDEDDIISFQRLNVSSNQRKLQKNDSLPRPPPTSSPSKASQPSTSKSEKNTTNGSCKVSSNDCSICFSNKANTAVYDCGHVCMCKICAEALRKHNQSAKCPICRKPVKDIIKLYAV